MSVRSYLVTNSLIQHFWVYYVFLHHHPIASLFLNFCVFRSGNILYEQKSCLVFFAL